MSASAPVHLLDRMALVVGAAVLGAFIWEGSIFSSDDALYAMMAREMWTSGDLLEPTWLGQRVFEKPPLLLWLLALFGGLLDWSETSLRLPGVLAGIGILGFVVRLVRWGERQLQPERKVAPWLGWMAVLLCLGTTTFVLHVRRPITDPLLVVGILGGLYGTLRLMDEGGRRWELVTGVSMGLATLAKGAAVGPAALVLMVALGLSSQRVAGARAVLIATLIALPWHLFMLVRHGADFWDSYVGYHVIGRGTRELVGTTGTSTYLDILSQMDGVISWLFLCGFVALGWIGWRGSEAGLRRMAMITIGIACVTGLALQLSATRLPHYLLPLAPLGAVAVSLGLVGCVSESAPRRAAAGGVLSLAAITFVMGPLVHVLAPDYGARSRSVAEAIRQSPAAEGDLVLWESYDPALLWYAERPGQIWARDPGFLEAQRSVDMMQRSGIIHEGDRASFQGAVDSGRPLVMVVPHGRRASMEEGLGVLRASGRMGAIDLPEHSTGLIWLEGRP